MDACCEKNGRLFSVRDVECAVKKLKSHPTIPPWWNSTDSEKKSKKRLKFEFVTAQFSLQQSVGNMTV